MNLLIQSPISSGNVSINGMTFHFHTNIGKRSSQEDSLLIHARNNVIVCAVTDGIATVKGGSYISYMTLKLIQNLIDKEPTVDYFRDLNSTIKYLADCNGFQGAGCTLEGIKIDSTGITSFHIGDSRTYLLNDSKPKQLHTDHKAGQYLCNYIGADDVEVDIEKFDLQNLLLTTDGFNKFIGKSLEALDYQLMCQTSDNNNDNSTAILINV